MTTLLDDLKRQAAAVPPPGALLIFRSQVDDLMRDVRATSSRRTGLGALSDDEFLELALKGEMRIAGILIKVRAGGAMPIDHDVSIALAQVRDAEAWLETYAKRLGLPVGVGIYRSGAGIGRVAIQISASHEIYGSKRVFLNHDRTRRDSENASANSIKRAMEVIDEASKAYAKRRERKG
jgi:hypothetical protein